MLGLHGWYSTNILGNRDGEVLDDPGSFKTKEESKLSVLEYILQPQVYPDLYTDFSHLVRINYYPPRGDNKEGWDNIDIFGWLGYPMQIKIDFLCRDSILAAPIVLDLALFMDLAQRLGMRGIQEWLSFYFKSPMCAPQLYPEHDLFIQLMKLKNTLRPGIRVLRLSRNSPRQTSPPRTSRPAICSLTIAGLLVFFEPPSDTQSRLKTSHQDRRGTACVVAAAALPWLKLTAPHTTTRTNS
jgi:hypothetical protein